MRTLSKSDFKIARDCVTKLYYAELGYPRTTDDDPYLQMLAQGGYMVEHLAKALFPDGIALEYDRTDPEESARRTAEYLHRDNVTLFEATLLHGRMLARVDVLRKVGNRFDLIEVKSKSFDGDDLDAGPMGPFRAKRAPHAIRKAWQPYLEDVAYQAHVLRAIFPQAQVVPYLMMPDKSRRTDIEGLPAMFSLRREVVRGRERTVVVEFIGDPEQVRRDDLMAQVNVSDEVELLRDEIAIEADRFAALIEGDTPVRELQAINWACRDCEFQGSEGDARSGFAECWGVLAHPRPEIFDLYQLGHTRLGERRLGDVLIENGAVSLADVPVDRLVKRDGMPTSYSRRQIVQIDHTRRNVPWIGPGLAPALAALRYPLHFIDFETAILALPYHRGMRPYEKVAFQWSSHRLASPDAAPAHREWLNVIDAWPNAKFLIALRDAIGDEGTILTWSAYEANILREIRAQLERYQLADPELVAWLDAALERVVDLHKICVADFFHPGMRGRTSIKVVLDALWMTDPEMRARYTEWMGLPADSTTGPYAGLPTVTIDERELDVADGTGAMQAYTAMLYGAERADPRLCSAWQELLLRYCKLDTMAMVLIFDYWKRHLAKA